MRFDWYAATVPDCSDAVLAVLQGAYVGSDVRGAKPMHGYDHGHEVFNPSGVVARVLSGGRNGNPHIWASGEATDAFVSIIRRYWPEHRVTRMDSAEDFDEQGAFDLLTAECLSVADDLGIKVRHHGDWHRAEDGRTLYLGSPKSPVTARLYEKGKQQLALARTDEQREAISPDWVRLEVQVKPQKDSKATAATATPQQAYGYAAWTQTLAERVFALDVPRVQVNVWKPSDDQASFDWMCRQYGPMLHRLRDSLGDWCSVGMTIGEALSRLDRDGGR